MVIPVSTTRGKAALKLVSPAGDVESEAHALNLLTGTDIVTLLDESTSHDALLLERLEGTSLVETVSPEEAVSIAGAIATSIGAVLAPPDVETFASRAIGWPKGIQQQHETALRDGRALSGEEFSLALDIISAMQSDQARTMTHGDLSMENILRTSSGNWVAIDPYLLCGPISNEAHTVVRSYLPRLMESSTPAKKVDNLTRRFCESAGADFEEARKISYARYVASYYWESQNGGSHENEEHLRIAAELTFQSISN